MKLTVELGSWTISFRISRHDHDAMTDAPQADDRGSVITLPTPVVEYADEAADLRFGFR